MGELLEAAQRLRSAAARIRGECLCHQTNHDARLAADLRARSAVGCNPLLGGFPICKNYLSWLAIVRKSGCAGYCVVQRETPPG